jgi:hypothetical protein
MAAPQTLARTPSTLSAVRSVGQADAVYCVASDQTVWMLTFAGINATWTQLPSVPQPTVGTRNLLAIQAVRAPGMMDYVYAQCDDGSSWSLSVGSPPIWSQLPTLPQPTTQVTPATSS